MIRRALLVCGLASSVLYVGTDLLGALSYPGYDYGGQAISEMSAVGAPTARLLAPFYVVYAVLFTAFGIGVRYQGGTRGLRTSGILLAAVGLLGLVGWPFFPMHMRGAERTFGDTMHLALGAADVMLLAAAMAFASTAFTRRFRLYSWASLLVMMLFGYLTSLDVPRVDAGLPTPWLGLFERISLGAYLLWIAVLSAKLARAEPRPVPADGASRIAA